MPGGKSKVIKKYSQNIFRCNYCGYIAKGEKAKELHAKYSHGVKNGGGSTHQKGVICAQCSKNYRNCSCVSSTPRL